MFEERKQGVLVLSSGLQDVRAGVVVQMSPLSANDEEVLQSTQGFWGV